MKALMMAAALLLVGALSAQTNFTFSIPNPAPTQTNNYPFAGPIMRYQQWYSRTEWVRAAVHPVRVNQIAFRAGAPGGQTGTTVDCEISIANGPLFAPAGQFDANLVSGTVTAPRMNRTLGNAVPGSFPMVVQLPADFVWDGRSSVVVEVKIFGNGRGNNLFPFDFQAANGGTNQITRLYDITSPNAQFPSVIQNGWGISTRFTFQEGVSTNFAAGCPGSGNFVPTATTSGGLPLPANSGWTQVVNAAASQRPALLVIGGSREMWGTVPLPLDLGLIGFPTCQLLVEPLVFMSTSTVGGGAGSGTASLNVPIPPVTEFFRGYLFTQWFIMDPGAQANGMAASNGLWSIIGG